MIETLNNYLIQHKSINIPGVGTIYMERVPAKTDFPNKQLFPPYFRLRFDKYYDTPDKEFFTYLALHKKVPDYDAIQLYNQFASDFRAKLKTGDKVEWNEIGVFTKDVSGEIVFEQANRFTQLYEPVAAERVIRTNAAHSILVGDREKTNVEMTELLNEESARPVVKKDVWWVYALVLFGIIVAVLFYHFYKNGFTWQSMANQQSLDLVKPVQQ